MFSVRAFLELTMNGHSSYININYTDAIPNIAKDLTEELFLEKTKTNHYF